MRARKNLQADGTTLHSNTRFINRKEFSEGWLTTMASTEPTTMLTDYAMAVEAIVFGMK